MDAAPAPTWQSQLDEAVDLLKKHLGTNLRSVVLYGSAARGDFVPGRSDLNLLIVLNDSQPQAHAALAEALRGMKQVEPFVAGLAGLPRTARAFASKFNAIRRTHRVVYGPDPLLDLPHDVALERFVAEQALRNLRLRLVYNFLKRGGDAAAYSRFAVGFLPGIYSAINSALELEGIAIPHGRDNQAELYANEFNVDTWVLMELGELRRSKSPLSASDILSFHSRMFALVMAALAWVEERWPA
jgi:predicted nucleotidyltransferase